MYSPLKMLLLAVCLLIAACEKPIVGDDDDGNVRMTFIPTTADVATRGTVVIGDYFTKLCVQLFDADGQKVFSQSKTQTRDDDNFGTLNVGLTPGTYTVVAVGHSSPVTPTIKSTELVQFTAKDGIKNTDTFCYCGEVTIDESHTSFELKMNRVTAMLEFTFSDETLPENFAGVRFDYSGGSANFNPTTAEGCTKSNQSELRGKSAHYYVFTFPYMSDEGLLKVTLTALDADQNALTTKVLTDVPVTRNRITKCSGPLFGEGDYTILQTGFGITVDTDWDGINYYTF